MFHMLDFGRDGHAVLVAAVAELARYRSVRRLTAWIAQHRDSGTMHVDLGPTLSLLVQLRGNRLPALQHFAQVRAPADRDQRFRLIATTH